MNILFVDDEPRVLEHLERLAAPHSEAGDWRVTCVGSGAEALLLLDAVRFDVIVSDMRMPVMDGAGLLAEVRRRHPDVVRLILCGPDEREAAMRSARVAHQFLTKPCTLESLTSVILRTVALQNLLADEKIRAAIGTLEQLPAAPRIFAELTVALEDPDSTPDTVADIIGKDPAISAKLLQLVSSSFFSRGRPVHDLRAAVVRLGLTTIRNVALAVEVFASGKRIILPDGQTVEALQEKALRVGKLAAKIAKPAQAPEAFLAGLLADVGLLALATAAPGILARAGAVAAASHTRLYDAERSFHDVTHAEIGAYVLGTWGLPYDMVEAVANHHAPRRIAQDGLGIAACVYFAMAIVEEDEIDEETIHRCGTEDDLARWRGFAEAL